jgi:hypothetical protein
MRVVLVGRIERGGGLVWIRDFRSDAVGNENGNQRGQKAIQLIYLLFVSFVLTMRSRGQDRMALSRGGT